MQKIFGADKGPRALRRTFSPEGPPGKPLQREPRREDTITSGLAGSAGFKISRLIWATPSMYVWVTRKALSLLKYRRLRIARRATEARSRPASTGASRSARTRSILLIYNRFTEKSTLRGGLATELWQFAEVSGILELDEWVSRRSEYQTVAAWMGKSPVRVGALASHGGAGR